MRNALNFSPKQREAWQLPDADRKTVTVRPGYKVYGLVGKKLTSWAEFCKKTLYVGKCTRKTVIRRIQKLTLYHYITFPWTLYQGCTALQQQCNVVYIHCWYPVSWYWLADPHFVYRSIPWKCWGIGTAPAVKVEITSQSRLSMPKSPKAKDIEMNKRPSVASGVATLCIMADWWGAMQGPS